MSTYLDSKGLSKFAMFWEMFTYLNQTNIDSAWLRDSRIALSECLAFYRHIPSGKKNPDEKYYFFIEKSFSNKNQKFPKIK